MVFVQECLTALTTVLLVQQSSINITKDRPSETATRASCTNPLLRKSDVAPIAQTPATQLSWSVTRIYELVIRLQRCLIHTDFPVRCLDPSDSWDTVRHPELFRCFGFYSNSSHCGNRNLMETLERQLP
jgi:hypothetical protein